MATSRNLIDLLASGLKVPTRTGDLTTVKDRLKIPREAVTPPPIPPFVSTPPPVPFRPTPFTTPTAIAPTPAQPQAPVAPAGTQVINLPIDSAVGFSQMLKDITRNILSGTPGTRNLLSAGQEAAGGLVGLPEELAATPGFAGLNLSQARRLASIEEAGLTNLFQGISGALDARRSRLDELVTLAGTALTEETQRAKDLVSLREAELDRAIQSEQQAFMNDLALTELQLSLPSGTTIKIGDRILEGFAPPGGEKVRAIADPNGGVLFYDDFGNIVKRVDRFGNIVGANELGVPSPGGPVIVSKDFKEWSTGFGKRVTGSDLHKTPDWQYDLSGNTGDNISAYAGGTVVEVRGGCKPGDKECNGKWGNTVVVEDSNGNKHRYAHLDAIGVENGQFIMPGESVGTMGNTGWSTGPHLHFEIRNSSGEIIDPNTITLDTRIAGKQEADIAEGLRKEYNSLSTEFYKVRDAYGRVIASAKDSSAAGDLALIFNYMKVLDPGSTVREGEFATAETSGSVPERIWAQYNKVFEGERLSPEMRKDFVNRAGKLYDSQEEIQQSIIDRYTELSNLSGIRPILVIGSLPEFEVSAPTSSFFGPQGTLRQLLQGLTNRNDSGIDDLQDTQNLIFK